MTRPWNKALELLVQNSSVPPTEGEAALALYIEAGRAFNTDPSGETRKNYNESVSGLRRFLGKDDRLRILHGDINALLLDSQTEESKTVEATQVPVQEMA